MKKSSRILIFGAGEAGRMLHAEYERRGRAHLIACFADDDIGKIGKTAFGKKIFGPSDSIPSIIKEQSIDQVIIAMPSASADRLSGIVEKIISADPGIRVHFIPSVEKYFDEIPLIPTLRDISFSDILGRDEVAIDIEAIRNYFSGKSVLITGAGGSIGSELCRQLLKFDIGSIIALGRGEFSIYSLAKSLGEFLRFMQVKPAVDYCIADVKNARLMETVFDEHRPDIVFHAAAHKHVPLMEFNEAEAVQNNVCGTRNVLELCGKYAVQKFVLVSTDKAVRPTNVMGATKRLAELVTAYYHRQKKVSTAIVRFGNVIGSRGSVIPLFREQIEKGGPVTVTHREVTRYFMSIPEAALLVINASAYSRGGELFVLDMGKQRKVLDIAERLISLYGFKPGEDIRIEFTGLRPGEKMFEELFYGRESLTKTGNEKIFILHEHDGEFDPAAIGHFLRKSADDLAGLRPGEIRSLLGALVPECELREKNSADKDRIIS